jgi:hypothetical protein
VSRIPPHVIIALVGGSGAGKSTIANELYQRHYFGGWIGWLFVRESFARPLKAAMEVAGVGRNHPGFRSFAQNWGDGAREVIPGIWIDLCRDRIASLKRQSIVVIEDVRYPDELSLADLSVKLVTKRPNNLTEQQRCHPSEGHWMRLETTYTLANDEPKDVTLIGDFLKDEIDKLVAEHS